MTIFRNSWGNTSLVILSALANSPFICRLCSPVLLRKQQNYPQFATKLLSPEPSPSRVRSSNHRDRAFSEIRAQLGAMSCLFFSIQDFNAASMVSIMLLQRWDRCVVDPGGEVWAIFFSVSMCIRTVETVERGMSSKEAMVPTEDPASFFLVISSFYVKHCGCCLLFVIGVVTQALFPFSVGFGRPMVMGRREK